MITHAAVKILNLHTNEEIVIPCHRHCDAFYILKQFAYKKNVDYKEIAQGFLDEEDNFYTRVEAWNHAYLHDQINPDALEHATQELFSEDLW